MANADASEELRKKRGNPSGFAATIHRAARRSGFASAMVIAAPGQSDHCNQAGSMHVHPRPIRPRRCRPEGCPSPGGSPACRSLSSSMFSPSGSMEPLWHTRCRWVGHPRHQFTVSMTHLMAMPQGSRADGKGSDLASPPPPPQTGHGTCTMVCLPACRQSHPCTYQPKLDFRTNGVPCPVCLKGR